MKMEKLLLLTNKTQGDLTHGSAYEAHNIKLLWDIGAEVNELTKKINFDNLLSKISDACQKSGIRFDDRLYRYAREVNKFWTRDEYFNVIKSIDTWGKLREVVPLLKLTREKEQKISKKNIDKSIVRCRDETYKEVRSIFKNLRKKCDPVLAELGVDIYDLDEALHLTNEQLVQKLENKDEAFEKGFRLIFNEAFVKNSRMFLAGINKEDIYTKFQSKINSFLKLELPKTENTLNQQILDIITTLKIVATNRATRIKLREEPLIIQLGKLSTYMKALSSEENYKQYVENKEILNKFISGLSG